MPSRAEIVEEAFSYIDQVGLPNFSMVRLARHMNMHERVLYRRVATRDELLAEVTNALLSQVQIPDERNLSWKPWLMQLARSLRATLRKHPLLEPLVVSRTTPPVPAAAALLEAVVRVLYRAGFRGDSLVAATTAFLVYVLGGTVLSTSSAPAAEDGSPTAEKVDAEHLAALEGHDHLRLFMQHVAARTSSGESLEGIADSYFEQGLQHVLDGVEAQLT